MRTAQITRKTKETEVSVNVNLDGTGQFNSGTGIGFFDHMLNQLANHSLIDISLTVNGDRHIDDHHTVEDTGITLGLAFKQALKNKKGIRRYGTSLLPMDETLIRVAVDLSGRAKLSWAVNLPTSKIGNFDTELIREFFQAFCNNSNITLHIDALRGVNSHHIAEACFKATAQALREAIEIDPRRINLVPSTKGNL
ncbi:MAG: imidazoleglycerol-phosphate dehydratase HisB [Aestuariivita sp.]|nr:imidazoleglycerol-phosphate dehydratase HisB [Aestuariivita sp.]